MSSVQPKPLFWFRLILSADTVTDTVTDTETTFQRENLVTHSMRYFIQGPLKPNLLPNFKYFQIFFEDQGLFSRFQKLILSRKKWEIGEKFETKRFCFRKKIAPIPIPRLDCGFGSRY